MPKPMKPSDIVGLVKTEVDAHVLGISTIDDILQESGFTTVIGNPEVSRAFSNPSNANNSSLIQKWVLENQVTVLGFSYRLNPDDAVSIFRKLMYQLRDKKLLEGYGGKIKAVYFAGLPAACERIKQIYGGDIGVFYGDETPNESLKIFKIDPSMAPKSKIWQHPYDRALDEFGNDVIKRADYSSVSPVDNSGSRNFGTKNEKLVDRIQHGKTRNFPPIIRAHAGPYQENRKEAVRQFMEWSKLLAEKGLLDVLSIGTSQLTQERFGGNWNGLPNGGGVPISSPEEYNEIFDISRPMLIRTYAGTKNIRELAEMYESTINIAWHALSLWWFSQIDGRGPNSVMDNLKEQFDTLEYIASTGKPYEPNVPHHFAFRGGDDISYVVSAVIAAKVAKKKGVKDMILQTMLNVPKYTWGVNDLAKTRATLNLVRELEDSSFRIYLQTRAGLDYLSHDPVKAKIQLAAVTALMDDIEAYNIQSPDIIHVVSYSEGNDLANPKVINESIQITRRALDLYRNLKKRGEVEDISENSELKDRTNYLVNGAKVVLSAIEECIQNPYSPEGLYSILKAGFLPIPQLMYCREEFPEAVKWATKVNKGCVDIYDGSKQIPVAERIRTVKQRLM